MFFFAGMFYYIIVLAFLASGVSSRSLSQNIEDSLLSKADQQNRAFFFRPYTRSGRLHRVQRIKQLRSAFFFRPHDPRHIPLKRSRKVKRSLEINQNTNNEVLSLGWLFDFEKSDAQVPNLKDSVLVVHRPSPEDHRELA